MEKLHYQGNVEILCAGNRRTPKVRIPVNSVTRMANPRPSALCHAPHGVTESGGARGGLEQEGINKLVGQGWTLNHVMLFLLEKKLKITSFLSL